MARSAAALQIRLLLGEECAEFGRFESIWFDAIDQQMPLALIPPGRELDTWDDGQSLLGASFHKFGNRPHRVMIANRYNPELVLNEVVDQLSRDPTAIARTRVHVKIDPVER